MKALSIVFIIAFTFFSCSDDDVKSGIDCIAESAYIHFSSSPDPDDSHTITFSVSYTGEMTLTSVKWEFGDGQSVTTEEHTVTHTYTNSGEFTAKANVELNNGQCGSSHTRTITIN